MNASQVDCEKLADGIESCFDVTGDSKFRKLYLRMIVGGGCGDVSTAVMLYLRDLGILADTIISKPRLPFDRSMEHIMVAVKDEPENPLIIDATYSQFLDYAGYSAAYDKITGRQIYPVERIIAFNINDRDNTVRKIARAALYFRDIESDLVNEVGYQCGDDWLPEVTTERGMIESLGPIWDPSNFSPYEPTELNLANGARWSRLICKTAVKLD